MNFQRFRPIVITALLALAAFSGGCHRLESGPFNLLVITLDTTRADSIGAYGNHDASTPNLDRLARQGVMFRECYTAVPLTLPSHCTLFTGRYPPAHQVRNNGTYFLPEAEATLAEILKEKGYGTFAFIASFTLLAKFGLGQGFDAYDEAFQQQRTVLNFHDEISADVITGKFASWLEQNHGKRFFTWIHFFDPHSPYQIHPEVDGRFSGSERLKYEGEISYVDRHVGDIIRLLESSGALRRTIIAIAGDHGEAFGEHGEFGHGIFCYEESLKVPLILYNPILFPRGRRVDERVNLADVMPSLLHYLEVECPPVVQGKSFHSLVAGKKEVRRRDVYFESRFGMEANNWAPITGWIRDDHKYIASLEPELYDLGRDSAESDNLLKRKSVLAHDLDQGLRRRILDLSSAEQAGRRELSAADVASLKTLGYISPASGRARDRIDAKRGIALYVQVERLKENAKSGNHPLLYSELERIIAANPGVQLPGFYELEFTLEKSAGRMDEALAVLEKAITVFPDHELFKMILATELSYRGRHARARELCREILKRNPRFAAALVLLGDISRKQEKLEDAAAHYRQALDIEPQNTRLREVLSELSTPGALRLDDMGKKAAALIAENRLTEARKILEKILQVEPGHVDALVNIGTVAHRSGDFAAALRYYQEAVRLNPDHALAHSNMGVVHFSLFQKDHARARLQPALECFERAIRLDPRLSDAYNGRGAVHMALGESSRAAEDFSKVIELRPGAVDAHFNLAYALVDSGRKSEALNVLSRFKESFYVKLDPRDRGELDALIAEIGR